MTMTALKDARVEFKTTSDTKDLLNLAAHLGGMDLSSYALGVLIENARQVVAAHTLISLTREGQKNLIAALSDPQPPTDAMKELMSLPDLPVRKK
ncbi:type II toxin-antitoxin system TacA family antitoxin [Burkholderia glumae]